MNYDLNKRDDETEDEHLARICNPQEIAECITFENAHDVIHHLVNTNQIAAKALKDELAYWNDQLGTL